MVGFDDLPARDPIQNNRVTLEEDTPRHFGDYHIEAGRTVVIETYNLSQGLDTILELRRSTDPDAASPDDPVVARNDDFGGSLASQIVWTCEEEGEYYVTISTFGLSSGTCGMQIIFE